MTDAEIIEHLAQPGGIESTLGRRLAITKDRVFFQRGYIRTERDEHNQIQNETLVLYVREIPLSPHV